MTAILLGLLLVLLICSAFFSSAETALFSLSSIQLHRIKESARPAGGRIEAMLLTPTQLLSTILIGNTLVNVTAATVGYAIAERLRPGHGEAIAIPAMTILLLIFGEVGPKRLALSRAEWLAIRYAFVLPVLVRLLRPLRALLESVTVFFREHLTTGPGSLSEDEFLTVVEVGEEEGVLDEEERTMVDGIIRLEETTAIDVMTPRVDLVGVELGATPAEALRIARSVKFRYLPLYRDSLDHVEGLLDVRRFLLADGPDIAACTVAPSFVPDNMPLDSLLASFQRENRRVAVVVDEFGGTAGMITRGDILEEIVPDVEHEYGETPPLIQVAGPGRWLVDASASMEEVNRELDLDLEEDGADRMAGWVTAQAERIPRPGEAVEAQGCRVTVQRRRKNRITLVLIEKLPSAVTTPGNAEGVLP